MAEHFFFFYNDPNDVRVIYEDLAAFLFLRAMSQVIVCKHLATPARDKPSN